VSSRRPRIAGEQRRPSDPVGAGSADPGSDEQAAEGVQAVGARSDDRQPPHDAVTAESPSTADSAPRAPLSRRTQVVLVMLGLVAVAAVAFALLATLTVRQAESGAQTQVDAEDAATAAASTAVETMLSYDHATIADDLDAATTLMTPDFAKEYEELAPQVIAAAEQRKIDVAATVRAIAPLECGQECSTSQVRLLAFVDQHRTIAGKPGTPAALSAVVTMKKVDGTWRVAGLTTS